MEYGTIIADGETLFRFAKKEAFPPGQNELPLSIFNDPELSCDWKKFRENPLTSFHLTEGKTIIIEITICDDIRNPKNPKRTGEVVKEWKQEIIYAPITAEQDLTHGANLAHSLIKGKKKSAVTDALRKNSKLIHRG
jgi:hypothetical protein